MFFMPGKRRSLASIFCAEFSYKMRVFFPCIVISVHLLYLLGRDDSRAENSHEEHEGIHVHVCEISGAFRARRRRYVSLFFCFCLCFLFILKRLKNILEHHLYTITREI